MAIDPSELDDLDLEESRQGRRRNPTLDRNARLSDQEYGSGEWYRFSHEAGFFGAATDSRITDTQIEQEDRSGVLHYVPVEFEQIKQVRVFATTVLPDVNKENWAIERPKRNAWYLGRNLFTKAFRWFNRTQTVPLILHGEIEVGADRMLARELQKKYAEELNDAYKEKKGKTRDDKLRPIEEKIRLEFNARFRSECIEKVRKWVLTPLNIDALPQSPRRPFLMIPKWRLDELYKEELEKKASVSGIDDKDFWNLTTGEDLDKYWVEYLYTGCGVLEPDPDRPSKQITKDETLVNFTRTYNPYEPADPPHPLREINGKFYIPRKYEDERGSTYRAHRRGALEYQTAEQVYNGEIETKNRTDYFTRPNGISRFKRRIDNPFIDPEFEFPSDAPRSDEAAFAHIAKQAQKWKDGDGGWDKHTCQKWSRKLRKYYEDWLEEEYDRFYPSECYDYRERFADDSSYYDESWESKADRIWDIIQLQIHVISYPQVVSYTSEEVDFRPLRVYIGRVENRRDIARLYNHWKMSKNMANTKASRDLDKSDIKNARRNDHGGPFTGLGQSALDWRFDELDTTAGTNEVLRERLLGPVWARRVRWQKMPHDGSLISRFTAIWDSWLTGIGVIQGSSTAAGLGTLPSWVKLHDDKLLGALRSYRSEYVWMQTAEYVARDPLDAWKYQDGIVVFSLLDEVNMRLDGPYKHKKSLRLNYNNCINLKRFLMEMWYWQPIEPNKDSIEHEIEELKLYHVTDILSKVVDATEGLPGDVIPPELKELGYGPRKKMARMIQEMRAIAVDWMESIAFEQHNLGRAHNYKALGSWMGHGFPYYIGDNNKTREMVGRLGFLIYEGGVADKLAGRGEARDRLYKTWTDDEKFESDNLMSRGISYRLWTGEAPPNDGQRQAADRFDLNFQLWQFAGFPETSRVDSEKKRTPAAKIARKMQLIPSSRLLNTLDLNDPNDWKRLDNEWEKIVADIKKEFPSLTRKQVERAREIWLTYHDVPLMETSYLVDAAS